MKYIDINPKVWESQEPIEFSQEELDIMAHNAGLEKKSDGTYTGGREAWDKYDYLLSSAI